MEKKTIFLELPCEIIEKIDEQNRLGDRSTFISELLEKQLHHEVSKMDFSSEIMTKMGSESIGRPLGELSLVNSRGISLGKFDINTMEGFENLAKKIGELSDDPLVRMKARRWL